MLFTFFVFDQKCSFWANLVQKIKIVSLSWNLVPRLIKYAEFSDDVHFFCFGPEISLLNKFGPKNQNSLSWNLVPRLMWIMENTMVMFTFSVLNPTFIENINVTFWRDMINLPSVYSQRLQFTSGFSCYSMKYNCVFIET